MFSCGSSVTLAALLVAAPVAASAGTVVAQAAPAVGAVISGSVVGDAGKPIAGVTVTLIGPTFARALSAADGTFRFERLAAGSYLVRFEKAGFAATSTSLDVAEGSTHVATATLAPATQSSLREIGRVATARGALALNTSTAATATLTAQNYLARGQNQVSNLLEELPGVELQRFSSGGAPGANTVVALRGADPAETQVLLDGHPVSGGPQGNYLIQFLNPLILGDIEVDKGPGASGNTIANQVNGTVNFRTPSITSELTAFATAGYNSYDGSSYAARVSDTVGKIGVLAGYARFGTPGYNTLPVLSVVPDGNPAPGVPAFATATTSVGASQTFDNRSEVFKLGVNFSGATSLTLGYLGLQTYADYTGNLTTLEPFKIVARCPNATDPNAVTGPGTGLDCGGVAGNSGLGTYTAPQFLGLVGKTVYASSVLDNLYLGNYETDNEPLFTADFRTAIGPGNLLARYYAGSINRSISDPNEMFQQLQCDDPACSFDVADANGDVSSAFFQQQTDILHGGDFRYAFAVGPNAYTLSYDSHGDRTTACSGAVYARLRCSVPGVLQTSSTIGARGNLRFGERFRASLANYFSHTTFVGSRYDPRVGLTYEPGANAIVRLSGGSSFVAPSAQDAFNVVPHVNRKTLFEGPGVRPETSVSFDLGTDVRTTSDSKIAFDLYLTRLFDRFSSYQVFLSNPLPSGVNAIQTTYNGGTALNKGIELTYLKAPRYGLGATVDVNFLRAFGSGDDYRLPNFNPSGTIYGNTSDGNQFPGYPYTHGRVALDYRTRNDVHPTIGMTYYGALNSFNESGFTLFDAAVDAKLRYGLHLAASVQNLFNHDDYRTFGEYGFGYNPPQPPGQSGGTTLFFAPPRMITLQLSRAFGPESDR